MPRDYKHVHQSVKNPRSSRGMIGFYVGLTLGLGAALGVHLYHTQHLDEPSAIVTPPLALNAKPENLAHQPRFEFYEILPNALPESVSKERITPVSPPPTKRQHTAHYFIQAGAFRRANEADRLRAELALLGLEAAIEKSQDWYRVRLGPYRDISQLKTDKHRLPQKTKPLIYKVKSPS